MPVATRAAIVQASHFWETRLIGYSAVIPRAMLSKLHNIQISAIVADIDGAGGILAFAGPSDVFRYHTSAQNLNISQAGMITFDTADLNYLLATGLLDDVATHEMAHVLGFGTLWSDDAFNDTSYFNYTGYYALRQYRHDSRQPLAQFVPTQQTTTGTPGGHWYENDPFFFNANTLAAELMTPYLSDSPFVSEVTWAQFADLGYKVKGITDDIPGGVAFPAPKGGKTARPSPSVNNLGGTGNGSTTTPRTGKTVR